MDVVCVGGASFCESINQPGHRNMCRDIYIYFTLLLRKATVKFLDVDLEGYTVYLFFQKTLFHYHFVKKL